MAIGLSFIIAAGLVPALKRPARHFGLVDVPCRRKRHSGAIPLTGGLAIFFGFLPAFLLNGPFLAPYATLASGMLFLLVVGLLDDFVDIRALLKLVCQVAVATAMVLIGGLEITQFGMPFGESVGVIGLGPFSIPFTIACVVFMINAFNMADGLDGLAGGMGFFVLLLLAFIGWLDGASTTLITVCLILATAVLGFLIYNMQSPFRKRASAFMGDAGSMMLGFAIAWLAIKIVESEGSSVYPITIAWLLLLPATDTLALFFRRLSLGRSPLAADRAHFHYILRRCGLSVRNTVRIIHLLVVTSGTIGILAWQNAWPQWPMFLGAVLVICGYMVLLTSAHRIMRWWLRKAKDDGRVTGNG